MWPACAPCNPEGDAFPFLRDLEVGLQGLDIAMYMMHMKLEDATSAGRTLLPQLGARPFKVVPPQTHKYQILCRIYAMPQDRAPLTDQQQNTPKNCMCRGSRAGCAAFCSPVTRGWLHGKASSSWLGPGAAVNLSKRLQECCRAVPACVSLVVLPSLRVELCPCAMCAW